MKNMREIKIDNSGQQRGAVLIVALIMLLLLTLVGIAGIRDTQLQEKMAGGTEDRALAFQAAESALREAESLLINGNCTVVAGCDPAVGYYGDLVPLPPRVDAANQPVSEADFWANWFGGAGAPDWQDNVASKVYVGGPSVVLLPNVQAQPRYVIELLPANYTTLPNTTNDSSCIAGAPGCTIIRDFLITARGVGRTDTAVVILQSMYRFSTTP